MSFLICKLTVLLNTYMNTLHNYALGQWVAGAEKGQELFNAITGDVLATASSKGLDFGRMCEYARTVGGPKLRKMTFQERGLMLKALALHLLSKKEEFYKISWATGATRIDSWVDIENADSEIADIVCFYTHRYLAG